MVRASGSGGIYVGNHFKLQPMKMEPTEGSETSVIINQTPGNYPKESLLYSVHGESLKSRISCFVYHSRFFILKLFLLPLCVWNVNNRPLSCHRCFISYSFSYSWRYTVCTLSDSVNKPPKTCILVYTHTNTYALFPLGHNFYAVSSSLILFWPLWVRIPESLLNKVVNFIVLFIVFVLMCTALPPPRVNPIAVNKYI